MDNTSTAWIGCIRRIIVFAPTSINHNITFCLCTVQSSRLAYSRSKNKLPASTERLSFLQAALDTNSKHDVLKRNPAHF